MNRLTVLLPALLLIASPSLASGTHDGGHDEMMAIGKAGEAAKVKRTVTITMLESDDGQMLFKPALLKVKAGETVRMKFVNKGETDHEFVMDDHAEIMKHKQVMQKFPEMEHDDANSIRLAPGAKGEIIWTFAKAGGFEFACLIPGHYESGMRGDINVRN